MNPFNAIFSAFLSLLVAMPLCCCSAKAGHLKEAAGCCQTEQSGETGQEPMLCACESHDAKDKPETVRLSDAEVMDIITPDSEQNVAPVLRSIKTISAPRPWIIDDPVGDVFARYSRWII